MKKWHYILILLLLCGVFFSCKSESVSFEFPDDVKSTLKEDGFYREDYYYYGTYDGAVVCFDTGMGDISFEVKVAGVEIYWPTFSNMFVYKEKKIYTLEEAYNLGFLTEKDIQSILQYHKTLYDREFGAGAYDKLFRR